MIDKAKRQENIQKMDSINNELICLNKAASIINEGKSIEETLKHIALIMPDAWPYPQYTAVRITYDNKTFDSNNFKPGKRSMTHSFETIDKKSGKIEVFYTKEFEVAGEEPFLYEGRDTVNNLVNIISRFINKKKEGDIIKTKPLQINDEISPDSIIDTPKLFKKLLSKHSTERDIFHDLMPFKVKEILLVANLYDTYVFEQEGRFSENILGEYYHLNLTSTPRITGVADNSEVMEHLNNKHYDLVILMMGLNKRTPIALSKIIKRKYPYIPIFLLLNNNLDISLLKEKPSMLESVDNHFVWNGDSKIFYTMVKHIEDKVNAKNDTTIGMVRVILLVEDSSKYYSRYLPLLYDTIRNQTRLLIGDITTDGLYKVLRLRARPKVLLASNFEDAITIYEEYKDNLLCVISDVSYPKDGKLCNNAGIELIKYVKENTPNIVTVLQSSDSDNAKKAMELDAVFINKNSDSLSLDIKNFISRYLGFGNFVFRDNKGNPIAEAKSLKEFVKIFETIPIESVIYHGLKFHFSLWFIARGEINIAKAIYAGCVSDYENPEDIRTFILDSIKKYKNERDIGKVVPFDETEFLNESTIVKLSSGALGGKGRGLAFINTLICNFYFSKLIPDLNITSPKTSIIGTDEYDEFMESNNLYDFVFKENNDRKIKQKFLKAKLSRHLVNNLRIALKYFTKPIAVRSSSLFEDSLMQPFSGIFSTYLLPNNNKDIEVRLKHLTDAIKLVYASIYYNNAKTYFEAVNYKIEEEKMAVILQEVVGKKFDDYYYPHISGTAQSHNYYPVGHMKPEEGFATAAVGLGTYVVEGKKSYRFSPAYPKIEINSPETLLKNSQTEFFAINLKKQDFDLLEGEDAALSKLEISEAEKHGNLKHCASVFDFNNNRIVAGLSAQGPRIINFPNILKYNYIPLAQTISSVLEIIKESIGAPAEIEFAVELNDDKLSSFYLLQIKPLVGNDEDFNIDTKKINKDKLLLFSEKSMGNGLIGDIKDVIFVKNEIFDNTKTVEMAEEIEKLNAVMMKQNKKYILIGPGRWGSKDHFIGIPVSWPQISNAKIIVEISLEEFPLDASLGSHFFHNVTSMNVGYFTVQHHATEDFINWSILSKQQIKIETKYFKHVQFSKPLTIAMDGKKRISMIMF